MKANPISVGKRIRSKRKEKGLTMVELGSMIDAPQSAISNWEKGDNLPNNERLVKLADIFDISVDELLYGLKSDELELAKKALSKVKEKTDEPEYYNVPLESEQELLLQAINIVKHAPAFKGCKFNDLPLTLYIEMVFREHYHNNVISNSSALNKLLAKLYEARDEISDYFAKSSNFSLNSNEEIFMELSVENLNQELGDDILNILDKTIDDIQKLEANSTDEIIAETIEIVILDLRDNQKIKLEELSDEKLSHYITLMMIDILKNQYPTASKTELMELTVQKLTQHQEYIVNFIRNPQYKKLENKT